MPRSLVPIPAGVAITDKSGLITTFFRIAWQALVDSFQQTPTAGALQKGLPSSTSLSAALATTAIYTTLAAGNYRISYSYRRTAVDGVASQLQATLGWTQDSVPLTEVQAANAIDSTTLGQQSGSKTIWADGATDLTIAVAYTSTTPGNMKFRIDAVVEWLA